MSPWRRGDWWFDPGDGDHDGTGFRHRLTLFWRRYGGYAVMAAVLGVALFVGLYVNHQSATRETTGLQRDRVENLRALHAECLSQKKAVDANTALLRSLVARPVTQFPVPAGADDALRATIEAANQRAVENQQVTLTQIDAQPRPDCSASARTLRRAQREVGHH